MKLIAGLLLGATLGSAAPQSLPRLAPDSFNKRALPQCHSDNLYRIFIDTKYASSASAFCSTYITFTSISTIIPRATVTLTARVTDATSFITNVVVATKTNTIPAANPTITLTPKARRDRDERLDKCPGKAGTYAPSLISSACSCLVTPVSVVSRTVTASSLTVTEKNTLHVTKPATTIVSTTTTVDLIGPPTATETVHIPLPPPPTEVIPSYCTDGDFEASNGGIFTPICGASYFMSPNAVISKYAETYKECADICDGSFDCVYFSFSLILTADNCLTFDRGFADFYEPDVDASFNSGFRAL
ncbi:hypothetical protein ACEPPN_011479 [Leptodophora sp. 'Broadleaf-Isolate-01']